MNSDKITFIIEGRKYNSWPEVEQQIKRKMFKDFTDHSVIVKCYEKKSFIDKLMFWRNGKLLDECTLKDLFGN